MFCPLCHAESRDDLTRCGGCRVALVGSLAEAQVSSTNLWKGEHQPTLERVLAALESQAIPSHHEQIVTETSRATILGMPLTPVKSVPAYEVWVFCSDLERARAAIATVTGKRASRTSSKPDPATAADGQAGIGSRILAGFSPVRSAMLLVAILFGAIAMFGEVIGMALIWIVGW